jgi:hypothetical protein
MYDTPAIDVQEAGTGSHHVPAAGRGGRRAEMAGNLDGLQHPELAVCAHSGTVQPPGQDVHP